MKPIKLKGKTTNDKLNHLEIILTRMSRRMQTKVLTVMPPIPISMVLDEVPASGVILRWMNPASVVVRTACLYVGKYDEKSTSIFSLSKDNAEGSNTFKFETRKDLTLVKPDFRLAAGDRVTFTAEKPAIIHGVWIAFLLEYAVKDSAKEKLLIDELLSQIEKEPDIGGETEEGEK